MSELTLLEPQPLFNDATSEHDWAAAPDLETAFSAFSEENHSLSLEAYKEVVNGAYLIQAFTKVCGHLKFDAKLAKQIRRYANHFATKNEEHIHFFGSMLLGVHKVRFTEDDRLAWYNDILDCDEIELIEAVQNCPTIEPEFVVSSDPMNQSFIWMLHQFHHSKLLHEHEIEEVKVELMKIMHYKFVTSLIAHSFKFPADREVALAAYSALSKKYDIKRYGSWGALIQARAESIVSRTGLHYQTYVRYDDDKNTVYMVNDIQSRIREVIKSYRAEFYNQREQNSRIGTSSSTIELQGEKVIRDRTQAFTLYRRYLYTTLTNRNDFVKPELIAVVSSAMSDVSPVHITEALEGLLLAMRDAKSPFAELIDETLLHAIDFIQRQQVKVNDLQFIITKLRALYTASRSADASVLRMRALGDELVNEFVRSKNDTVKAGVRTAVLLYLVLRALSRNYYTK
jgi:hypothetical protein